MCGPLALPLATVAAAGIAGGATMYAAKKGAKAQKRAAAEAKADAIQTKAANERAVNAANQKQPNLGSLFLSNRNANSGGVGSTMLTGPGGAKIGSSLLGKATLLGG